MSRWSVGSAPGSVSDAWDTRVLVDDALASASAARVLAAHAAGKTREEVIMPPVNPAPTKNGRVQALQRLAIQKDPLPSTITSAPVQNPNPIYPKLPEISGDQVRITVAAVNGSQPGGERDQTRFERLRRLFSAGKSNGRNSPPADIDMEKLRKDCWMGIPHKLRPHAWRLLSIHIDIPRMCPLIPLFQQKLVQEVGSFDVSQLTREQCELVEADSFWCASALLDSIHDNYTFAQPGIQRKVLQLKHLMSRVDRPLHLHLESNGIEYLQFSFRWMNNLLMREIPLRATIRLWDTYLSEPDGFSQFHSYVCAAFLRTWSRQLQAERDFQGIMILLQNLPTQCWGDREICELTADAFSLMSVFDGARRHLSSPADL
ncbi:hypothetical protein TELCIR_09602 [Teladorsagia circumcincta]|uniref:Rab-GAP TBC domain-containing protein n=1 Tax=Teladorsagia circumcincta TaxID=45464 RepID=A0A2G9UEC2_TELCI|nr:hypothetical protein TELCIR_09602 [Teladorsagia circumcincta]